MRNYSVTEFSDKLDKQFKTIILAEYTVTAETIDDAKAIIDERRNPETKSINVGNEKNNLCAQWAAEGLIVKNKEIVGTYKNEWYYTSKHADDDKDIFACFE